MIFLNMEYTWLALTSVVCVLLYVYLTWTHSYWRKKGLPYIEPRIIFGSLKENILGKKCLAECYQDFYR